MGADLIRGLARRLAEVRGPTIPRSRVRARRTSRVDTALRSAGCSFGPRVRFNGSLVRHLGESSDLTRALTKPHMESTLQALPAGKSGGF